MLKGAFSRLQSGAPGPVEIPPGILPDLIYKGFEDMAWRFGVMFADAKDAKQDRVKRLIELLKSDVSLTRAAATLSLPWYGDERVIDPLMQATKDSDELVSRTATWAFHALQKTILYRKHGGL
jgi:hypothetical protein